MNEVTIFNFKQHEVRTLVRDGLPWWVATDVCAVLGIANPSDAVARLDEDERAGVGIADPHGRVQETVVISEPGLYSLILRSRKAEAKTFRRWITHEVLPSIRQTGAYTPAPRDPIVEVDRTAALVGQLAGMLGGKVMEIDASLTSVTQRVAAVEQRQEQVDPRAIEVRVFELHQLKRLLVEGTKDSAQPIAHPVFWRALKEHVGVASFQNRAALDVPLVEKAIAFARNWAFQRGLQPPDRNQEATPPADRAL